MKITKSQLKQIIKEELESVREEQGYGFKNPECLKNIERVKNDGFFPLKGASFWTSKGDTVYVLQRDSDTLKPKWFDMGAYVGEEPSPADQKELLQIALACVKNKCAKNSQIKVKSDPNITRIGIRVLTRKDFADAYDLRCYE